MAIVYTTYINKGGVGKSSLTVNLACLVASEMNKRVLVIDTEQGSCSQMFGILPKNQKFYLYDVLAGKKKAKDIIVNVKKNIDVLPSNINIYLLEEKSLPNWDRERYENLYDLIEEVEDDYDYIFIDTPPNFGIMVKNVLAVTDKILIPFVPVSLNVKNLVETVTEITKFSNTENPSLQIAGVVPMMVKKISYQHSKYLPLGRDYCKKQKIKMFDSVIPEASLYVNATEQKIPAVWMKLSKAEKEKVEPYNELLKELFK